MKTIVILLTLSIAISCVLNAQTQIATNDSGIQFVQGLTWQQVKAKAKAENKFIFVDCYATWCGPCKYMSQKIFTQKRVGDYFNTRFISVAVQMDRTKSDSFEVQQWYADAMSMDKKYSIGLYPTYLFFSPDGEAVHRIVGESNDGNEFIAKTEDVFSPNKQYYTLVGHYKEHPGDSLFLRNALITALQAGDQASASSIGDSYMSCLKDPYSKDNIGLIVNVTKSSKDKGFRLLLANPKKADEAWGEETYIEQLLKSVIVRELVDSVLTKKVVQVNWPLLVGEINNRYSTLQGGDDLISVANFTLRKSITKQEIIPFFSVGLDKSAWKRIADNLRRKYEGFNSDKLIAEQKINYYEYKNDKTGLDKALYYYGTQYGSQLSNYDLNEVSWKIFSNSSNPKVLSLGLRMSKRAIANYPKAKIEDVDTYANLLYKTGNKEGAIFWEKKALELRSTVPGGDVKEIESNFEKMQKGEKTWRDNTPLAN